MSCSRLTKRRSIEIPRNQWPELRDLYKNNWPQHILTVYTLQNFIEWAEKNPHMRDMQITSVDDNWREHGTFMLEDRLRLRYNVFFNTLQPENSEILANTLNLLNPMAVYTMLYAEQARLVAEKHMRKLGLTNFEDKYCPTLLYYLPKEKAIHLKFKSVPTFLIVPLSERNVQQIDDLWPHRHPGSDSCIRRVIRYNMTFGAYHETTGELCAWVLHWDCGTIGLLQVEEKYRRRGLGEHLVRRLSVKLAENGYDSIATIMDNNVASRHLFGKLGFSVIDRVYWLDKDAKKNSCMQSQCQHKKG